MADEASTPINEVAAGAFDGLFHTSSGVNDELKALEDAINARLERAKKRAKKAAGRLTGGASTVDDEYWAWAHKADSLHWWLLFTGLTEPKGKGGKTLSRDEKAEWMFKYVNWRTRFLSCEYAGTYEESYVPGMGPEKEEGDDGRRKLFSPLPAGMVPATLAVNVQFVYPSPIIDAVGNGSLSGQSFASKDMNAVAASRASLSRFAAPSLSSKNVSSAPFHASLGKTSQEDGGPSNGP